VFDVFRAQESHHAFQLSEVLFLFWGPLFCRSEQLNEEKCAPGNCPPDKAIRPIPPTRLQSSDLSSPSLTNAGRSQSELDLIMRPATRICPIGSVVTTEWNWSKSANLAAQRVIRLLSGALFAERALFAWRFHVKSFGLPASLSRLMTGVLLSSSKCVLPTLRRPTMLV